GQGTKRRRRFADPMRGQTVRRARVAKSIATRVAKLESRRVSAPTRERIVRFRYPEPPHSGRTLLVAEGLEKSYGGPPVFRDISFDVASDERLMMMGANGDGKTRLLRIMAAEIEGAVR